MKAQIKHNEIIEIYNSIPESWSNISNLYALDESELYDLSWSGNEGCKFYPVEETPRPDYDPLYEISGPTYTIDDTNHKVIQSWTTTPVSNEKAWEIVRQRRNQKLYATDWTQLPDAQLSPEEKARYQNYRRQLRDITSQPDPFGIVWPDLMSQPAMPASVSARQIRLWLVQHNIGLAMVEAAIDAIADPAQRDMVRVEWEYAPYIERSHPMLLPLASALGMTTEQVDSAFVEASEL